MAKVSLRVYNQEIEAMIDRGQLDEAVAHCKHILKTFPKCLETYRLLGKAYLEYKRYPDAVDIFSRVLAAAPDDFVANVGMSIIRDEDNKLDEAIWHMERAFETQTSNGAIKSELQRLYGRREGVQPPNIRMTRGALAQMYVRGELYPAAIAQIKDVLKEDPARMDMQVLLARAYYRSGLKNDAAEVATTVLRSNPYCLDANRVLVEILSVDHPESVQPYRQRVVELDPYAAQVTSSVFLSDEVPNMAVTLERLDWNGQPVGMQADWEATQAISLESSQPQEEPPPDWLKGAFGTTSSLSQPVPTGQAQVGPAPAFEATAPSAKPAEPADEIPDFLRAAGWGEATGAFDESKPAFADNEPASNQPIEQGELPDWVKAMAPPQAAAATPAEEEELPDWINKIGTSALPVPSTESSEQPDWMKQFEQPAAPAQPAEDQPDWLKQFAESEQPASSASEEQPDWLKSFASEPEATPSATAMGDLDWLSQLGEQPGAKTAEPSSGESDFLKELGSQPESAAPSTGEFDFLNELTKETEQLAPSMSPETPATDSLGMSSEEQDDSFAWLENLAAKQGATEGLLTKPEERLQEEPDWIKQVKGTEAPQPPAPPAQPPVAQPAGNVEELGKSTQEQDDSFAWLESLAAKQGATEGLLTKPEERVQEEPEWVKQAKDVQAQQPTAPAVAEQPASVENTAAWLRSLDQEEAAPKAQTTSYEDTAAWLRSLDEAEEAVAPKPAEIAPADELPAWMQDIGGKETPAAESTAPVEPQAAEVPQPVVPEVPKPQTGGLPSWLRDLDQDEAQKPASEEGLPAWLRDETGEVVAEPTKIEPTRTTDWHPVEPKQPEPAPAPSTPEPVVPPPPPAPVKAAEEPVAAPPPQPEPVRAAPEEPKKAAPPAKPVKEPTPTIRRAPEPVMSLDPILIQARNELARSNIPGALEDYGKLIKKARFLEEVIHDLREALYRYPVEVSIWQALGDAYMRANRLQDALDSYTKAEELLR